MKWLSRKTAQTKQASYGGTSGIAFRRSAGQYDDEWDSERAVQEGVNRVVWVYRAIDAIASNAARLPVVYSVHDTPDAGYQPVPNHPVSQLLNTRANKSEDAYAFRYRLSSQLLLSTKGVFIEIIRNNAGDVAALQLFNPIHVKPQPDETGFVPNYEIHVPGYPIANVPAERMLWIKKTHPFDPYRSLTPFAPAGLSIETDWYAKLYNRNFLLNDGRPGGMIVIKGDMLEEDKAELRARYAGNLANAGRISVITSEDGADFVDTAVTPRDAQYEQTRKQTKEEILMAFGVPESVLANASGRTFDNAEQERLIFWMETMQPHLNLIERALDILDDDPSHFAQFDTRKVDVIQRAEMKRREFLLREFENGLITQNEYREETDRLKITNGGGRLYIPNTKSPVIDIDENWAKELPPDLADMPQPIGRPGNSEDEFNPEDDDVADPRGPSAPADDEKRARGPELTLRVVTENRESSVKVESAENKVAVGPWEVDETKFFQMKTDTLDDYDRWLTVMKRTLDRFFERQNRVVVEKIRGQKSKKRWDSGDSMDPLSVYDIQTWDSQLQEDAEPVIKGTMQEFGETTARVLDSEFDITDAAVAAAVALQIRRLVKINLTTYELIANEIEEARTFAESIDSLVERVNAVFLAAKEYRSERAALSEVVGAANAGKNLAASNSAKNLRKTWASIGDERVRDSHETVDGTSVGLDALFQVGESKMAYPGDPMGGAEETANCRCAMFVGTTSDILV